MVWAEVPSTTLQRKMTNEPDLTKQRRSISRNNQGCTWTQPRATRPCAKQTELSQQPLCCGNPHPGALQQGKMFPLCEARAVLATALGLRQQEAEPGQLSGGRAASGVASMGICGDVGAGQRPSLRRRRSCVTRVNPSISLCLHQWAASQDL